MKKYDIMFIGKLLPKDMEVTVKSKLKNVMQDAGNAFQWSIINGLEQNLGHELKIINMLPIGSFPNNYNDIYVKEEKFKHTDNSDDLNVGFLNLAYIKHFTRKYYLRKPTLSWVNKIEEYPKVLLVYDLDDSFLDTLRIAKKINPKIKTCVIVPDLPQFVNLSKNKSILLSIYNKLKAHKINNCLQFVDSFILVTKQMADELPQNKPYRVIEGIAQDNNFQIKPKTEKNNTKSIVYTGTLHEKFGIKILVDAFKMTSNNNYRLIICGIGDAVDYINKMTIVDKRIIYKGQVSRDKALEIQLEATILVNPRQNVELFTKYSFPSKTMEYLASGVPLIAYKLDGIPDEYHDYINYVESNSVEALYNKIIELFEKTDEELSIIGEKARKFVLNNKNSKIQTQKIIELLDDL